MKGIFVTGTDTDVGKTLISSLLVSSLKHFGFEPIYFKPVQTGAESDSEKVFSLTSNAFVEPVYSLKEPASPNRAARAEGVQIEIEKVRSEIQKIKNFCVVEGAGGMLVPLNENQTMRDLAVLFKLPLLIVARTKLGTINHTLLTIEAAKSAGLRISGVVLSGSEDFAVAETIENHGHTRVVAHIPTLDAINAACVKQLGPEFFPLSLLKQMESSS